MSEYDGHQYVGIDLHRRRSVIVRQTEDGVQLSAVRILNDPVALGLQLEQAGDSPDVVLEATYGGYWAADVLQPAGARVHLAHPLGVKGFAYRRVKNDLRDAADLADLLRMGRLPEAWIAPPQVRETGPATFNIPDGPPRPSKVAVRREDVLAVMATDPHRPWHVREITAALNTVKQSTIALHLSAWARKNLLVKTATATYRLPEQPVTAALAKPLAATNTPTSRTA